MVLMVYIFIFLFKLRLKNQDSWDRIHDNTSEITRTQIAFCPRLFVFGDDSVLKHVNIFKARSVHEKMEQIFDICGSLC